MRVGGGIGGVGWGGVGWGRVGWGGVGDYRAVREKFFFLWWIETWT